MLLTGTFDRNVDEKFRLALPKPIRDAVSAQPNPAVLYVAPGTDGSLAIYPEISFAALAEKLSGASPNAAGVRGFSRLFFARAQRVEIDKSGRVRIPKELAELSQITKEVVLVGVRDHIELWDKGQWNSYLQANEPMYDEIAEQAFGAEQIVATPDANESNKPLPR